MVDSEPKGIYTLCGVDENNKVTAIITYYDADDVLCDKDIKVDFDKKGKYEIYLTDETHDGELVNTTSDITLCMKPNSFVLIKEI